jgi:collagenase-like PrtC family protease
MKYYSVPADFNKETVDQYEALNHRFKDSRVIEVYGSITVDNSMESGRAVDMLPRKDLLDLFEYVGYLRQRGIDFNYTLNAPFMSRNRDLTPEGIDEIVGFLEKLYQGGVRALTVALPSLMEIVRSSGLDFKVKASVLCQVTTPNKAALYRQMGVERIVVDESINRDFFVLQQINQIMDGRVEVIANAVCHKECTYRMFHYNQMAADSVHIDGPVSHDYYKHRCLLRRYEEIGNLLRLSFIRPEDIGYYTDFGIFYFKLQGRQAIARGQPLRTLESYFKEDYDGDLIDMLEMYDPLNSFKVRVDNKKLAGFIEPFVENPGFCRHNCKECGYCDAFARKCIDVKEAEQVIQMAREFYQQYDGFKKALQQANAKRRAAAGTNREMKGKPPIELDLG